jgi:hypothetical protein
VNFKYSFDASYVQRKTGSEGGAIDTNGRGTLLTSEECLMHPDIQVRNPILQRRLRSRFQGISWNYECDLARRGIEGGTDILMIYADL